MRRRRSGAAGFSLTEALVALAIAAFMAAVLTRFVSGTRVNAFKVREEVAMDILGDSLLERLTARDLEPGRTNGHSGVLRWRIDIAPIPYTARARAISVAKPGASPGGLRTSALGLSSDSGAASGEDTGGGGFNLAAAFGQSSQGGQSGAGGGGSAVPGLGSSANRSGSDKAAPAIVWTPYHVTAVINAPSGRSYAIDTIRIVPQRTRPRPGQTEQSGQAE